MKMGGGRNKPPLLFIYRREIDGSIYKREYLRIRLSR